MAFKTVLNDKFFKFYILPFVLQEKIHQRDIFFVITFLLIFKYNYIEVGLQVDKSQIHALINKQSKNTKTIQEIRAEWGTFHLQAISRQRDILNNKLKS